MLIINALIGLTLCAVGLVFAAHSPLYDRPGAWRIAVGVFLVWCVYFWTWLPYSPHLTLGLQFQEWWAILDLLLIVVTAEQIDRWWGVCLFLIGIFHLCCHVCYSFAHIPFFEYSLLLDIGFYLQIIILIMIGFDGVRNRIINICRNDRDAVGKNKAA